MGRNFTIKFESIGKKACIVFDPDDGSELLFFGYAKSCILRHPDILEEEVKEFNLETKTIHISHMYK